MKFSNLKRARPLLGTFVQVELRAAAPAEKLQRWVSEAFEVIAQVDRLMSFHQPSSELSRLNRASARLWLRLHPWTVQVLRASTEFFARSRGAFDIRCAGALEKTSLAHRPPIEIRGTRARKTGPWVLDLGGLAKGFAVDRAVETLARLAVGTHASGVVNAGGDLRVWGREPTAVHLMSGHQVAGPLHLRATAAATSSMNLSDARQSAAGYVRMPEGRPVREKKSATVFASRCLWADALTKVALLATPRTAATCLSSYRARAFLFG